MDGDQVGLVLDGNVIAYVLDGSPASMSQDFRKGDLILKVDDTTVSDPIVLKDMLVNGAPGSSISLTIRAKNEASSSSPAIKRIVLTRIASNALADRTHMYELLATLKVPMILGC
jgi:C-terminal processing protease CtpA/Prc